MQMQGHSNSHVPRMKQRNPCTRYVPRHGHLTQLLRFAQHLSDPPLDPANLDYARLIAGVGSREGSVVDQAKSFS